MLALAAFAFATPVFADDDDDNELGAYIYEGTVDSFGDRPVEDIGDLDSLHDDDDDIDDVWNVVGGGDPVPNPLWGDDDEDVDFTIEQLTASPHVLVIHASESTSSPVVAVGAIEGEVGSDGSLMIELEEVDNSGFEGRAHFHLDDDDDDDTEVTIGVWQVQAAGV